MWQLLLYVVPLESSEEEEEEHRHIVVSGVENGNIKSSLSRNRICHMMVLISDLLERDSCVTQHIENT
jgi:hypothetical protein